MRNWSNGVMELWSCGIMDVGIRQLGIRLWGISVSVLFVEIFSKIFLKILQ